MHTQWSTPVAPSPSNYLSLPFSQGAILPHQPVAGPSTAPLASPPTGSGAHAPSLDCSLCDTGPFAHAATGVAFCCEEPECAPEESCGPACPSTTFVGWDEMLLDDCKECSIDNQDGLSAASSVPVQMGGDPCCWPPGPPNFDSFAACCTDACFDLPDLAAMGSGSASVAGSATPQEDCPDCWGGPLSTSASVDGLTESGSSVATPREQDLLADSPKGLAQLMKGLDEKAIQEIVSSAPPARPSHALGELTCRMHSSIAVAAYPICGTARLLGRPPSTPLIPTSRSTTTSLPLPISSSPPCSTPRLHLLSSSNSVRRLSTSPSPPSRSYRLSCLSLANGMAVPSPSTANIT